MRLGFSRKFSHFAGVLQRINEQGCDITTCLLLNFLDDEQARQAVQFVYKSPAGETRIRPFFEIPRISDKLRSMGPGDAFVDTDLRQLTDECLALDAQQASSPKADAA